MANKTKSLEEQNHAYCDDTLQLKASLELHFLEIGKRLMEIRDGQLYRPYWDTFEEYLMEMKLTAPTASKIITVYDKFVLQYKIPQKKLAAAGGWSMLYEIVPVSTSKQAATQWVEKAAEHPQYELRAEIREAMGKGSDAAPRDMLSTVDGTILIKRNAKGQWSAGVNANRCSLYADTLPDLVKLIKKEHEQGD